MLFFNYLTIHGSPANRSNSVRRILFIQVRDPEDRPTEKTHPSHAQGMMLAGVAMFVRCYACDVGNTNRSSCSSSLTESMGLERKPSKPASR